MAVNQAGMETVQHGTSAFPIALYLIDLPHGTVSWHWHQEFEIGIVTEGNVLCRIASIQSVLHPGDGFFVNSGSLHEMEPEKDGSPFRMHSAVFHPDLPAGGRDTVFQQKYITPLMENLSFPGTYLSRKIPWQSRILDHLEAVYTACAGQEFGYELSVRSSLSQILLEVLRNVPEDNGERSQVQIRKHARLQSMILYIQEHYGESVTLREIASAGSVSESECLRTFRQDLDTTPVTYLKSYRLQQAAYLLETTRRSSAEIAQICGFNDHSYFARSFRELYQLTPSLYRKSRK